MTSVRPLSIAIPTLVVVLSLGACSSRAYAQNAAPQASAPKPLSKATLADVAFIAGVGTGSLGGGVIEEHWSTPAGDSMMGMFRYTKDGKAVFYEFLLIEQTATGPILRLKHFDPGLIGREEKAEVFSYDLVDLKPRYASFEHPDKQTRLTFDGTDGKRLVVTLDQMKKGAWQSQKFFYDHVPPPSPSSR